MDTQLEIENAWFNIVNVSGTVENKSAEGVDISLIGNQALWTVKVNTTTELLDVDGHHLGANLGTNAIDLFKKGTTVQVVGVRDKNDPLIHASTVYLAQ